MKIAFDMDNTIFTQGSVGFKYRDSEPIKKNIKILNRLARENDIFIYTARHFDYFLWTKSQLDDAGVQYSGLIMGKFNYDVLIDDKSFNSSILNNDKALDNLIKDLKAGE